MAVVWRMICGEILVRDTEGSFFRAMTQHGSELPRHTRSS